MKGGLGDWLLLQLAPPLAAVTIRLLHALVRIETLDEEFPRSFWQAGGKRYSRLLA